MRDAPHMRARDIVLKTAGDVARMRRASRIAGNVLRSLGGFLRPGVTTALIDRFCEAHMLKAGGRTILRDFRGFPGCVCTSVNQVAVHGTPGGYKLRAGDLITVDVMVEAGGWYGDAAWTYPIGAIGEDAGRLLKAAWRSSVAGILAARAGNHLGDIGNAVETTAAKFGCVVLEDFAGHGIGRELHEEPTVLYTGEAGTGLPIVPGMVLTIEPVLSTGSRSFHLLPDSWSCVLDDKHALAAQFEHTVAIFRDRTEILTFPRMRLRDHLDFPPDFQ